MAWGRKEGGGRKEPRFGLAAALADLRLNPKDRIPPADEKPKRPVAARKVDEEEDEDPSPPPRERKPRERRAKRRRSRSRARLSLGRSIYWGLVLSLWASIATVG